MTLMIAFLLFGIMQIVAGFIGIEYHWGAGWAWGLIIVSMLTRATILITIAAFFGAKDVWEWHWFMALIFAAPGIVFMVAAYVPSILQSLLPRQQ
jgi:hypothetical protein